MAKGNPRGRKVRFKLSPALGDGCASEICDDPSIVAERVNQWCEEFRDYRGGGESFSVKTVLMSDADVEALPEL